MPAVAVCQRQRVLVHGNGTVKETSDTRLAVAVRTASQGHGALAVWSARPAKPRAPVLASPSWWTLAGAVLGAATASMFTMVALGKAPWLALQDATARAPIAAAPAAQTTRDSDPSRAPEPPAATLVSTFTSGTKRHLLKSNVSAKKAERALAPGSTPAGGGPASGPSAAVETPTPHAVGPISNLEDFGGRE